MTSGVLTFTSCQAPSADPFCRALVDRIGRAIDMPTALVADLPWKERERLFDAGDIDVCWMCGWQYVERADRGEPLDVAAATVMADPRYNDRPIYFSDVIVRSDSRFRVFEDLRDATWTYSEPQSLSGYHVVRYFLATKNLEGQSFFRSVVESGSHAGSTHLVLDGAVDASAVDTTVLAALMRRRPEIASQLRVIGTIGPSPAPPWVMRTSLPRSLRERLRDAFATIHEQRDGQRILESAGVKRFALVENADYDPIRKMALVAASTRLG